MEGLLSTYLKLLSQWNPNFQQKRTFLRAVSLAISLCLALGRKTITRWLGAAGIDDLDWSAAYRLFSRRLWSPRVLFRPVLDEVVRLVPGDGPIAVAYDDSLVRKTGKRIKGSSWQRDPLSPPFRVNFVWGLRYLQASLLVPLYERDSLTPARSLPVQFEQLPKFKKPSKKASSTVIERYKELTKKHNSSTVFVRELRYLRHELDSRGLQDRILLAVGDASFCNRTCFNALVPRTHILARTRLNTRLCLRANGEGGKHRFYDRKKFSPDDVRQDPSRPYATTSIFYGGAFRNVRYKEVSEVYWQHATKRRPLRLIVIAPTPFRRDKNGNLYYHKPAYLLTTDLTSDVKTLIQRYFDRWQIEVNFKEEKDLMGLGVAQVWAPRSIPRLPAFVAASYSILLLASIQRFGDRRDPNFFMQRPAWRRHEEPGRPSCLDLLALLRAEVLERPELVTPFGITPTQKTMIAKAAA